MSALGSPDLRWAAIAVLAELISMGAFARVHRRMLSAAGAEPGGGTPEDYAAVIRADTVLWTRVIRDAGIKGE